MAKQKRQAKVLYNDQTDSFELWIRSSEKDEWGFSLSAQCQALEGERDTNFIHFSFMKEILHCIKLGYEVFEA